MSLCAKGVSRRLHCTARGGGAGHLPSPEAEHPSCCRARPSQTPGTNPPAQWRVGWGWKRVRRPRGLQTTRGVRSGMGQERGVDLSTGQGGTKESCLMLSIRHGVMRTSNPSVEGIHHGEVHQEPRPHESLAKASCPVRGPSILPPIPGSPHRLLRRGGGALCFSNEQLPRTPWVQTVFPSAPPEVTPARPAQGGATALPKRCLTESADAGGGMSERSPGRGGRGQAYGRAPWVIG